jgi:glutamine amidotransferase
MFLIFSLPLSCFSGFHTLNMQVAIINYNAGNIYSVDYALRRIGIDPLITADKNMIRQADKVIFPGQGEANTTMRFLREQELDRLIIDLKQPVLGICIGMQLLCKHSEEGNTDCLGVFDADVRRFRPQQWEDKVPHMGWNDIYNQGRLKGKFQSNLPWSFLNFFVNFNSNFPFKNIYTMKIFYPLTG